MNSHNSPTAELHGNNLVLNGDILISNVSSLSLQINHYLNIFRLQVLNVDLKNVERIDTAGVALLEHIMDTAESMNISCNLQNINDTVSETMTYFALKETTEKQDRHEEDKQIFQKIGNRLYQVGHRISDFLYLIADTMDYAAIGLFSSQGRRKGEFINQSILIGMNALPIIALISFLIGLILALQSAAQLRQFGAAIFVADLIAISMTREMGPIMTAIVLAGRSGSAITSEIATMVVTEETDALKSMGLNPIRYVLVPKVYAILFTMPMLTMLSMVIGILGAFFIAVTYLDIGFEPFYNQVVNALVFKDIITGLIKSVVFAWLIVTIGAYYGFQVRGGAAEVGKATTASVVASIFWVIFMDCILGLLFYFPLRITI